MNLQRKAIAIVAALLFLIIGINTTILITNMYGKYKHAILAKTAAAGQGMQDDLEKVLMLGIPIESFEGVSEKLSDMKKRDEGLGYALITDAKARILFHSDESQIGKKLKAGSSQVLASSDNMRLLTTDSFYDLSFPLANAEGAIGGNLRLGIHKAAINAQLYKLLLWSLGASFAIFLLSLLLVSYSISRFITRPIISMEKTANKIAFGQLTSEIDVHGTDEIASLGNAINSMTFNLKDVLSKIRRITDSISDVTSQITKSSEDVMRVTEVQKQAIEETSSATDDLNTSISQIASSSESLSEAARESSSAIMETKTAINAIADKAHNFTETADETASSVEEMVTTMKSISENVDVLSMTSDEIASSIEEVYTTTTGIEKSAGESVSLAETVMMNASEKGIRSYKTAMEGMEVIKKNVSALANVINGLGKKSEDIGMILGVINDVSDQTNRLSLNAAILASKAGEHGRGFAVVAGQIKELAERALLSTKEIGGLIRSVQEETRSSVKIAAEGLQAVDQGMELSKDINEALNEIIDSSKASTDMAKAIQRATTEEVVVIKRIAASVENVTEQTGAISNALQEQYRGSTFILGETKKVKDISQQVSSATSEQKEVSDQIASTIESVAAQAFQIAGSTGSQKEKSTAILQSMEKIQGSTQTLMNSTHSMNDVLSKLKEESLSLLSVMEKFEA
jgi:methyl-accepting chemotaxis protein